MPSYRISLTQASNKGLVRTKNEDRIAIDRDHNVALLADGVGGQASGEVASTLAVNILLLDFNNIVTNQQTSFINNAKAINKALSDAAITCSQKIINIASSQPQYKGMATTIVGALFKGNEIAFIHVGDSRLYRFRGGLLTQLTKDHSLYQQTLDSQTVSELDACDIPKNIITQALGLARKLSPSCSIKKTELGDIYILCSDGLSDLATEKEMSETIASFSTGSDLDNAEMLIQLALAKGGTDNVSVVVAEVLDKPENLSFWAKITNHLKISFKY